MTTNSDPATRVYLGWVNSILCEAGLLVGSLDDLKSGVALATIIDTLWPDAHLSPNVHETNYDDTSNDINNVQGILDYITKENITNNISAQDIVQGDEKAWLDLLWILILHFNVHSPATAPYGRTDEAGVRNLLEWCLLMLPGVSLDKGKPLVENICTENLLVHLIAQFCPVEEEHEAVGLLTNAILSAEEYLGISKYIVDPVAMVEGTVPERHVLVYLALLRRKSEQIEEMGSMAAEMAAAGGAEAEEKLGWEESFSNDDIGGEIEMADPQQFLDMLGDQPITPEMLKQLQDRFGPIEIEIIEGSSEESCERGTSQESSHEVLEDMDEDVGPINVWPQQPIFYSDSGDKHRNVPLLVELEEAEATERLSQELLNSRHSAGEKDGDEMNFDILGEAVVLDDGEALSPCNADYDAKLGQDVKDGSWRQFNSRAMPHLSGSLKPPWMSPVPFHQTGNEMDMHERHGEHDHLMHSTPRHLSEAEASDGDETGDENLDERLKNEAVERQMEHLSDGPVRDTADTEHDEMEYEETEVDIDDLTTEQIQELLMAAQEQGVPFDPRLIDLAAQRGLEFEIVMEDEEGNIIEGLPNGAPMRSTNFTELVQELKMASGQDMEVSLQYDSGVGTGTTTATTTDTDPESMGASMNFGMLQQQIRQHLHHTSDKRQFGYTENEGMNVPTTSLNDLRDISDDEGKNKNTCECPTGKRVGTDLSATSESTEQHFHNNNRRPVSRKGNTKGRLFDQLDNHPKSHDIHGKNDDKDITSDEEIHPQKADSCKSSDVDTDNEDGDKRKWESNKSDKSFSSNTSVDGVIDTRADLDESEEEIVITMEVPGIPTEDGGFIIDMSKMFIPISIPGEGDQEITIEIDPNNFDFSSMVQNEDGTIEVDLEKEVNKWMSQQSASKPVQYKHGAENFTFPTTGGNRANIIEQLDTSDSEINSAIRATVTEKLPFKQKSSLDESQGYTGPTITPRSESPTSQNQLDTSIRSADASNASSSSLFDVSQAEDEVLQLLDQIGNKGHLMRRELESSHQREISLHHEKSEDEIRLGETIVLLEKELDVLRKENKNLYKEINSGRSISSRDQNMITRLESAVDDLQGRVHVVQRENNDLKSHNATLERRSRMVMHKGVMTEQVGTESKNIQIGHPFFKLRSRNTQTVPPFTRDFGVQQYGHFFSKNAVTSTHDPIFRSLRSKTSGTQCDQTIQVDRGITVISAQEKLWFGHMAHASTQVRTVNRSHEKKPTRDASTNTLEQQVLSTQVAVSSDARYPWQQRKQQEEPVKSNIPLKAGKPLRSIHTKAGQRSNSPLHSGPLKASKPVEKIFHQVNHPTDSPVMENSATESMETDDEPEGPDKWQRLSSASHITDPTVVKLQRSLASATLENDLLQTKMKQSKTEMATRLGEWAQLLEASKAELERAKSDVMGRSDPMRNANIRNLEQKVEDLESALDMAQKENSQLSNRIESSSLKETAPPKVKYLEKQNAQLRKTLEKVKCEKDQLIKDFGQLRQHHRHSVEAVTELESSLVGMASERQHLRSEIQVLRDEYDYLKKGMDIMEQYFSADVLDSLENEESSKRSSPSTNHSSVVDEAGKEADADITVLDRNDLVTKESEAVLSALKDGKNETNVVVMPSGGAEGSLHKHISALAARIQSELGIKVQLVGEVDPSEILGASLNSQDGTRSLTPKQDKQDPDAVEHLFQSVRPEGTPNKLKLSDLEDVEDIVSRAIPSPRDTSRDSSPVSPRHGTEHIEKKDIGNLNSDELRRKRLGMFVDAYTKPRETSPEGRNLSPSGRSPSPGRSRKSPTSHCDDASPNHLVEPSTDHQMKTYTELRHQIQTQSPLSPRDTSTSPVRNHDLTTKPDNMRKKFSSPLLPSKFNLTSVGVAKNGGSHSNDAEVASANSGHPWSSNMKWKPFSRLAKATRLKQEPRPPSRGLSRSDMEAEAALIQDDILLRYGGDSRESARDDAQEKKPSRGRPNPEPTDNTRKVREDRERKPKETKQSSKGTERSSRSSREKEQKQRNSHTQKTVRKSEVSKKDALVKSRKTAWTDESSLSTETKPEKSVFRDFDYTDYLLSKYGGEDESTDATALSEHQSNLRPSSAFSSLPSPDAIDSSSSDSDSPIPDLLTSRKTPAYSSHHTPYSKYENTPSYGTRSRTSGLTSTTESSSTTIKPKLTTAWSDVSYTPRPLSSSPTRPLHGTTPRTTETPRKDNPPSPTKNIGSTRQSSISDVKPVSTIADGGNSSYRTDRSDISSVRLHSSPPLRSSYTSVPSPRSSITPQPWHSSRTSTYSPYTSDKLDTSRTETRTFYSEFFNKEESDDKYWKEPKPYDYRHEVSSSSSWREPRKRDAWSDNDRHWIDTASSGAKKDRHYTAAPSSPSPYEHMSSGRSTPYQSLTDQWTFSSSRVVPETETSGRTSYLDRKGSTSSSIYGLGRRNYERSGVDVSSPTRSLLNKTHTDRDTRYYLDGDSSSPDMSSNSTTNYGNEAFLKPGDERLFMDNILEKYAGSSEQTTSYSWNARPGPSLGQQSELYTSIIDRSSKRRGGELDRYSAAPTRSSTSTSRYNPATSFTSYSASRYRDAPEADDKFTVGGYDRYSTLPTISSPLADDKERARRAEIEGLLNKYAPMY